MADVKFDTIDRDVETKLDKGGQPHRTALRIVFDDAAAERSLAIAAAVVRLQARWRADGTVPAKLNVNLSELVQRRPRTVVREMTNAEMLEKLRSGGLDVSSIIAVVS